MIILLFTHNLYAVGNATARINSHLDRYPLGNHTEVWITIVNTCTDTVIVESGDVFDITLNRPDAHITLEPWPGGEFNARLYSAECGPNDSTEILFNL